MNSMKKVLKLAVAFVLVMVSLLVPSNVYAASGTVAELNINVKSRNEIIATVVMPGEYDTLGFKCVLGFDSDVVKVVKSQFLDSIYGVDPDGNKVAAYAIHNVKEDSVNYRCATIYPLEKKSEGYTAMVVTFSLKDGQTLSEDSIKLNLWEVSDEEGKKLVASDKTHGKIEETKCNHSETVNKTVVKASCDHKGQENVECALCGHVLKTIEHEMLPHSFGEWTTVKEAGCEEKGTEERKCSVCGKIETRETAALGHDYGEAVVTKEPTCVEKGVKTQTCKKCGKEITEEIPMVDHKFGAWKTAKPATCEEKGTEERKCSVCGKTETRETAALGHEYGEAVVTKEPTCTETGVKTKTCKHCDKEITEVIPAAGHKFGEWIVTKEATETEEGSKERICSVCGAKEVEVIAKVETTKPAKPETTQPSKPSTENKKDETTNKTDITKKDNTVKTGDETDASVFALSGMSSMVLATILYSINRRRKILN